MNDDKHIVARKEYEALLATPEKQSAVRDMIDNTTMQLGMKIGWVSAQIKAKQDEIMALTDATPDQKKQACAKLQLTIDQAESELEQHVQFSVFIREEYGV